MIDVATLLAWGGFYKNVKAGVIIFKEGTCCYHYHQLVEGMVEWGNLNSDGKEFIQSIISPGECFGEFPLFDGEPYAADAMAVKDSIIICVPKSKFQQMLLENGDIHLAFSNYFVRCLRQKFLLMKTIALENPEVVVSTVLKTIKSRYCQEDEDPRNIQVDLTRQQIANMTGLRVETVIRTIRNLKNKGILEIDHGKVYI